MKRTYILDAAAVFVLACILVAPLFRLEYLNNWSSIEATWISDARMLQEHFPHPDWQPLWYCGNRYDYLYPLGLRYAPALLSKIGGVSTARAYHFYVGLVYAFGIAGVYLLVRTGSGSRLGALLSAAAVALVSPCFLLLSLIRHDSAWWEPQRLHVLMTYGEGPHITALSFLGVALAATIATLRKPNHALTALAAVFAALAVTHNFYGATSLAIFFSLAVWAAWLANPSWSTIRRALAIAALAYGLCAFWLTPSYVKLTIDDLHWVSEPTSVPWRIATAAAMCLFFVFSYRLAKGNPNAMWTVFISGSAILLSFYVLPFFYFGGAVVANPRRLLPEFDMVCVFVFVAVILRMRKVPRLRAVAAVALAIAFLPAVRYLRHPWGPFPRSGPVENQYEYRITKWVHDHLPGERAFATGSLRFWYDTWFDNAQTDGLSMQGMQNQNVPNGSYQIAKGTRADLAILWLQALGTGAVIVPDNTSPESYHDFVDPKKFHGALSELYDDHAGTVIYQVPRTQTSIGRLIPQGSLSRIGPVRAGDDIDTLSRYVAVVEDPSRGPVNVSWTDANAFRIRAAVNPGEAILVQETYDSAWHAYAGGRPLPVRKDPVMGFMIIDSPPGVQSIEARFVVPFENRAGAVLSGLCLLLLIPLFVFGSSTRNGPAKVAAHRRYSASGS